MSYWADTSYLLAGAPRAPRHNREESCPYCYGYGYRPRGLGAHDPPSGPKAVRCDNCDGVGLISKPSWKR